MKFVMVLTQIIRTFNSMLRDLKLDAFGLRLVAVLFSIISLVNSCASLSEDSETRRGSELQKDSVLNSAHEKNDVDKLFVQDPFFIGSGEEDLGCTRGEPEASLDIQVFPTRKFEILDKRTAIESVALSEEDSLFIRHWGCEYYAQTYRFVFRSTTSRYEETRSIYKKAVSLLTRVERANTSPVSIRKGISALIGYIDDYNSKKLGEEIDFSKSEIREYLTVDKLTQLKPDKYLLELTFAIVPL